MISWCSFSFSHPGDQLNLNFSTNSQRLVWWQHSLPLYHSRPWRSRNISQLFDFVTPISKLSPIASISSTQLTSLREASSFSVFNSDVSVAFHLNAWHLNIHQPQLHSSAYTVPPDTCAVPPSHATGCQMNVRDDECSRQHTVIDKWILLCLLHKWPETQHHPAI